MVLNVSEEFIRDRSSAESFQRGYAYYQEGAVVSLIRRGGVVQALVEGSQAEPYAVQIATDNGVVIEVACDCPYDWGGWCKHGVASLLAILHRPESIEERPAVETLLAELDRQQLQTILLTLVERDIALADVIQGQVERLRAVPPTESAPIAHSARDRQTPVDVKAIRHEIRAILHSVDGMRPSDAYWRVGGLVGEVQQVLEKAWGFVRAGEGNAALAVLGAITEEYVEDWCDLDDSDGELGGFFEDLGAAWIEAILTADLTEDERGEWASKLDSWAEDVVQYGIDDAFWTASAAAVQGWDEPELRRILAGEPAAATTEGTVRASLDAGLTAARLNVLERQGRTDEFLRLAQAAGQGERYASMLIALGRVAEGMAAAMQSLSTPTQALALAGTINERGELEHALRLAEHGLTLEGPKAPLATWLRDLADGAGQRERALAAAVVAVREDPNLPAFLRVQDLAGSRWPDYREDLLAHLRQRKYFFPKGEVEIFLHEGLIDDAIGAVATSHAGEIVQRVVLAAIESRPEWVVQTCRRQAEPTMNEARAQHYAEAAHWLAYARDAYRVLGQTAEWRAYLNGLISQHARKYKLRPMLEALK